MHLTPWQIEVAKANKRFRVICAGRRAGKTVLAVEEMVTCAALIDGARVAYIAPTYQQARDIAWDLLIKRVSPIAVKINESRLEVEIHNKHKGTSKIFLRGWESVETLRGQSFDLLILDEVAMMRRFFVNWLEVLRPALTDRRGRAMFISTPKGFNHFYDLYNTEDPDHQSFHFTTYDNPHIPVDEIEAAQRQMTEDSFAQEYKADFRKQEGLVYKEFSRDRHVVVDLPESFNRVLLGVDFGFTNPTAVLHIGIDYDNNYWVTTEWYRTQQTEDQVVEYVAASGVPQVYPDPENASACEALKRKGVNVREVVKGKDSVVSGISKVRELFKQNKLKIHQSCKNLISELEMYRYPDEKPDKNLEEVPVKEHDHALDALRYVIMMTYGTSAQRQQSNIELWTEEYV